MTDESKTLLAARQRIHRGAERYFGSLEADLRDVELAARADERTTLAGSVAPWKPPARDCRALNHDLDDGGICRDCSVLDEVEEKEALRAALAIEREVNTANVNSFNAIDDRYHDLVCAIRALRNSGYDGPFIGDATEPIFAAFRALELGDK